MLERLMGNPIAWAALALLTVFSAAFAIYTWIAGKNRKQFSFSCRTTEIIIAGKRNIDRLRISYDGKEIRDLSCTKFYVWNSGNTVLHDSDIVSSKPICIKNNDSATILSAEIVRVSEETNNFFIKNISDQSVEFSFDYADHGEGFVLQILHTGKSSDLEMTCKIKGGHEVKDRSIRSRKRKDAIADKLIDLSFTWLPPIMGLGAFIAGLFLAMGIANSSINTWIGVPLSVVALVAPGVLGCWIGLKLVGAINQKTHRDIPYSLTR